MSQATKGIVNMPTGILM